MSIRKLYIAIICIGAPVQAIALQNDAAPTDVRDYQACVADSDDTAPDAPDEYLIASELFAAGRAADAEQAALTALNSRLELLGEHHAELLPVLNLLAEIRLAEAAWDRLIDTRVQSLEICAALYGNADYRTVDARLALKDAEFRAESDESVRNELLRAESLTQEYTRLFAGRRFAEALSASTGAAAIQLRIRGEASREYATDLMWTAVIHRQLQSWENAGTLFEAALKAFRQSTGTDHPQYAICCGAAGHMYLRQEQYDEAITLLDEAVSVFRRVNVPCIDFAAALGNLAQVYQHRGEYAQAEPLFLSAFRLCQEICDETHPALATSINNLAKIYEFQGDFGRAEPLLREALRIKREQFGPVSSEHALALGNLGLLYAKQRDYARAEPLLVEALGLRKAILGEGHPETAISLRNVARVYRATNRHREALVMCEQALDITMENYGTSSVRYARSLNDLASLQLSLNQHEAAARSYAAVVEIFQRELGENHPHYATSLLGLAHAQRTSTEPGEWLETLQRVHGIQKNSLGIHHPGLAETLQYEATANYALGNASEAFRLSTEALHLTRNALDRMSVSQSERQQLALVGLARWHIDYVLSMSQLTAASIPDTYEAVLPFKGQVFQRQHAIRRLRRAADDDPNSDVGRILVELSAAASQLDRLVRIIPADHEALRHRQLVENTAIAIEGFQQDLASAAGPLQHSMASNGGLTALAESLPADVAFIDFYRYSQYVPEPGPDDKQWKDAYAAFVIRPGQDLSVVWLGHGRPLDHAINVWREQILQGSEGDAGVVVRRLLWEPLDPYVRDADIVVICPDGAINRVPFGALPGAEQQTYLLEERAFAVTPTPWMLIAPTLEPHSPTGSFLGIGNVDYDVPTGTVGSIEQSLPELPEAEGGGLWRPLANTGLESEAVGQLFSASHPDAEVFQFSGASATEANVFGAARNCAYLHFATHGYFSSALIRPLSTSIDEDHQSVFLNTDVAGWHPGLLSGIVLAGANTSPASGGSEGILTAIEIAEMDLANAELVTLSACDTGLGMVAGGEGVLGLQRSFHLAGARTTVASVWSVPDLPTRLLMENFYANLWNSEMTRLEALRTAQLRMLRGEILPTTEATNDSSDPVRKLPPIIWGGFVLSGDWK